MFGALCLVMIDATSSDLVRCECGRLFHESDGNGCDHADCAASRAAAAEEVGCELESAAQDAMREDFFDDPDYG